MKYHVGYLMVLGLAVLSPSCKKGGKDVGNDYPVEEESHGETKGNDKIMMYTLTNQNGFVAKISEYGATLVSLEVPDRDGKLADVTLGYDDLAGYENDSSFMGCAVGRFGNRIAGGKFAIEGKEYTLETNNDPGGIPCTLHGGKEGFNQKVWQGEEVEKDKARGVKLTYTSADGEEGFPGELETTVTYWLTDDNELIFQVEASTDQTTPVNIVHHSYWNLSGEAGTTILDHELQLLADEFLPTNEGLIPTGEKLSVYNTPMDFTKFKTIGKELEADYEPLKFAGGYDHCWVLRDLEEGQSVRLAARVRDPKSGRVMEVFTDQPGIQFYCGNFLDGRTSGKGGVKYPKHGGLCLESQLFPDSPNQKDFPDSLLKEGEVYRHTLVHKFYAK